MHDLSLMDALLNSIQPLKPVKTIKLAVGEFSEHTEQALQETFEMLNTDSPYFAKTQLTFTSKTGEIICNNCQYRGAEHGKIKRSKMHGVPPIIQCAKCNSFDTTVIEDGGVEILEVIY